jgi:replicative DNA helicase
MGVNRELWDLDLERQVLGSCLLKPELLLRYGLVQEDFASTPHRVIWAALLYLFAEGDGVDTVRLRARLLDTGKLEAVGGLEYVLGLTATIPDADLPIERLQHFRRLRALSDATQTVARHCAEANLDHAVNALADAHAAALQGARKGRTVSGIELCEDLLDELTGAKPSTPLVHPGFSLLADKLGLLPLGCTVAVLASTNVGKSSYALELLLRAAQRSVGAGYLSVEDQKPVVRARLAGMVSGVSSRKILQGRIEPHELEPLTRGLGELDRLKRHLSVSILQGGTEADVCAAMTELASRGAQIVVVDYLQKISSSRSYASKAHEVASIASRITSHAQRLGVICILVSQCTRDKTKLNECPSKHDMKESGDLENMCDAIIGLWREYEDDFAPIWVRLLKVKWGGVGVSWRLQRDRKTARLDEVEGSDRELPPDQRGDWAHRKNGRASC